MAKTKEPQMEKIAISIPKELLRLVDQYARKRLENRSTALRQLVAEALRYQELQEAAEGYQKGRATLWEVAARLGLHYREAEEALLSVGVPLLHVEPAEVDLAQIERHARDLERSR
jgi:metal-responsive CopG/Arc/MetJ family transcriptional regulator